jgi:hypothetical protein
MDYISMPDGFLGEQNFQKRKYYIIKPWEIISKKGNIFNFHRKKITKKGNFDGLCKRTVGKYFQKRKLFRFFTEIKLPKKEILMDYVITSYHIQMNRISQLCNMVTISGSLMAYSSRLFSLTKPNLT